MQKCKLEFDMNMRTNLVKAFDFLFVYIYHLPTSLGIVSE